MVTQFILLAIGAYLLGSVPAAYLAIKWTRGVDIRKVGTGKVGAANVLNAGPKWLAVPVALFDIGKGALSVWVAQLLGMGAASQVTVGLCAIVGHNWPIYLGFKSSGRGVFASLGVISMLSWPLGLIMLVVPYLFAPIKQVAFGVFLALVILPFLSYFLAKTMGVEDKVAITCGFIVLTSMALLKRVVARRTELSKHVPLPTVIINRLLFDRDIADRRLWNSHSSASKG
ncbi:MAG: glycerol-3-phosphate acyltransferase [Dehalococcoidales bacterium]|nr:glycerol-3-phosphate acyltransferase [Dehalococcoidales bacterium]